MAKNTFEKMFNFTNNLGDGNWKERPFFTSQISKKYKRFMSSNIFTSKSEGKGERSYINTENVNWNPLESNLAVLIKI